MLHARGEKSEASTTPLMYASSYGKYCAAVEDMGFDYYRFEASHGGAGAVAGAAPAAAAAEEAVAGGGGGAR